MVTDNSLDIFTLFSTDKESEEDGIWCNLSDVTGFKIRAIYSKAVADLREKLMKPFAAITRAGLDIPADKNEEIGLRVLAGAILADWKGLKMPTNMDDRTKAIFDAIPEGKLKVDENGFLAYNADSAYAMVKALPRLGSYIAAQSTETQNFRDGLREEGEKN